MFEKLNINKELKSMFSSETYKNRRAKLAKDLKSGIILLLGNTDLSMNYPSNTYHFRQDSSFLYFFGLNQPNLAGVIDIDNNKEYLFGNDVDMEDIIWMGPQPSMKETAFKVGVNEVKEYDCLQSFFSDVINKKQQVHYLPPYRAENKLTIYNILGIKPIVQKSYSSVELIKAIVSQREIKSNEEILQMENAAAIGYKMHTIAMKIAKIGIKEQEIAGMIEGIAISNGASVSFPVILSQNGQTLHNHNHDLLLTNGRLLIVDAGAENNMNYCSDYTRVMPSNGKFTSMQKDIYNIVLKANNTAIELIKPGVQYCQVHAEACKIIFNGMKEMGVFKGDAFEAVSQGAHAILMPHGLGHAIGLDVHDMEDLGENYVGYDDETKRSDLFGTAYLRMGKRLKEGFAITVEPGIYFIPELIAKWENERKFENFIDYNKLKSFIGFGGIRLEDDILVTKNGCKFIGNRVPITVDEVENLMQ